MTTEANPTLGKFENLFKEWVWDNLVEAGLTALFTQVPALAVWPIKPILSYIIRLYADRLFSAIKLCVDLQAIAFVNEAHKRAFDKASVTLKIIAHDKGLDSPEFKNARENAKTELAKYVHFNGS
jgi:hypothetical protein